MKRREEKREEKGGLRCSVLWCLLLFCAVCLLVCVSVSASPCLLCSLALSCAVLSSCPVHSVPAVRTLLHSTMVSCFLLLVDVSSTFADFKLHPHQVQPLSSVYVDDKNNGGTNNPQPSRGKWTKNIDFEGPIPLIDHVHLDARNVNQQQNNRMSR